MRSGLFALARTVLLKMLPYFYLSHETNLPYIGSWYFSVLILKRFTSLWRLSQQTSRWWVWVILFFSVLILCAIDITEVGFIVECPIITSCITNFDLQILCATACLDCPWNTHALINHNKEHLKYKLSTQAHMKESLPQHTSKINDYECVGKIARRHFLFFIFFF